MQVEGYSGVRGMTEFYNPVKAVFGPGSFDKLPELIANRVYAIVTYDETFSMQLVRRLEDAGRGAAIIINNVKANPDFPEVKAGCEELKKLPKFPEVSNNVFILPKPFSSWTLNNTNWQWESPVEMPDPYTDETVPDYSYAAIWDEDNQEWYAFNTNEDKVTWNPNTSTWE